MDQLPVRVEGAAALVEEAELLEAELSELGAEALELLSDVDCRVGSQSREDQPEPLSRRDRLEAELAAVDRVERLARERLPEQLAVEVVRP